MRWSVRIRVLLCLGTDLTATQGQLPIASGIQNIGEQHQILANK